MKRNKILGVVFIATLVVVFFGSCSLEKVTKDERMEKFMSDLNTTSRSGIGDHFVSGNPDATAVEVAFPVAGNSWSWSGGTASGTMAASGAESDVTVTSISWQDMGTPLTGESWKILIMSYNNGSAGTLQSEEPSVSE